MVEISERLACLFTTSLEDQNRSYTIEVPHLELEDGSLTAGETYRVAVLEGSESPTSSIPSTSIQSQPDEQAPPVESVDIREVTIETLGDQGDGTAEVEWGYVVIIPGARLSDEVTVEIKNACQKVTFMMIHESDSMTGEPPLESEDSLVDDAVDDEK